MSLGRKSRGSYTSNACALCRARKRKCDGVQPTCGFCEKRDDECVWGSELPKKPASKQLVDSLKNRIEALAKENEVLRLALSRCNCLGREHLDSNNETSAETYDDQSNESRSRPNSPDDLEELCAPTKNLVLESDEWRMYGPTSAFRMNTTQANLEHRESNASLLSKAPGGFDNGIYKLYAEDNIDWSRHLPITAITKGEHDRLLELGFNFTLAWGPRFLPELFFRDMYRALSSSTPVGTEYYSPMLHNAIVALACSFSDDPAIRDVETRRIFLKHAKTFLDEECQHPNISTTQGLDLMASCHSNMADQTLGYMYFGMSARISQALGLNVDCSTWVTSGLISHQTMVQRSWAYWDLLSTDVCWSLYVGRDCCLPDPSSAANKVPPPPIDDGIDLAAWDWSSLSTKVPAQPKRVASIFLASCELMKIGRKIVNVLNSGVRQKNTYKHVTEIDLELNYWKENLSPDIDLSTTSKVTALLHRRLVLQMLYWWLLSLLHRPFYYRPVKTNLELDHVKMCDRAAHTMVSLLSKYDDLYGIRFAPNVVMQVTFSAGTVCLLSAVRALSGPRVAEKRLSDSLTQADACVKYLGKIAISYESSQKIKEILENMARAWVVPRIGLRFNDILPHDQMESESRSEAHILPAAQTAIPESLEPWEHEILKPLESSESFAYQQLVEGTHAYLASGSSMPGGQTLPNQPFMTFNYMASQEQIPPYPGLNGTFSGSDPEMPAADMEMSAQELMDDLARFWR